MKKQSLMLSSLLLLAMSLTAQQREERTFIYGEEVNPREEWKLDPSDSRPLEQQLDEMLAGTDITYRITSHHILLFKEADSRKTKAQYSLHGYVTDAISQETLIGANVYCPAYRTGTVTNAYGFFTLPLPEGRHTVIISYVGYESVMKTINLQSNETLNCPLNATSELKEILVESDRPETGASSTRMSGHTVSLQQIKETPAVLGESDVVKALQKLPGVQTGFTSTSQMSVRGGNLDQNLMMLDGVSLYNVNHALGFESAFMTDAVKHVDFFKGSFPARYGGRLSSVVDVRTKDGDMQHYHGLVSVGALTSHLALEGPLVKDRTSFLLSGRRTYAGWLMSLAVRQVDDVSRFDIYFYDLNAKLNHKFSDTDRLYVGYYRGQDGLRVHFDFNDSYVYTSEESENMYSGDIPVDPEHKVIQMECQTTSIERNKQSVHWGNTLYTLRWNHLYSSDLFSNLTLSYTQFKMRSEMGSHNIYRQNDQMLQNDSYSSKFRSGIDDVMALYDFDYHPVQQHHIKLGGSYTWHQFRPEVQTLRSSWIEEGEMTHNNSRTGDTPNRSHEVALYADDDMTLGDRWQLNAGLRGVVYGVKGKSYPGIEPRLSASYLWTRGLHAKASYTQMHQYVHQLTTSLISMPTDLWVSVTKDFRPMSAQQWAVGLACDRYRGWEFLLEGYWKEMHHVLEYVDGANFFGSSSGWASKVASGNGRSQGLELMARRTQGRTTGSASYTLSWSDRWFPDGSINGGKHYPYDYDRRHNLQLLLQHQLTKRIDVSANWSYLSGGRATVSTQKTWYIAPNQNNGNREYPAQDDYYSGRNNFRLDSRHQLDLSINFRRPTKHGERTWNISVMNAYMHKNQDLVWLDEHKGRMRIRQITLIPILPSCSYSYKF